MSARAVDAMPYLTPRERQVVRLLADGLQRKEIAQRLGIQESTVKSHLARAFASFGAHDRAHLVALAMRAGEINGDHN